MVKKIFLSIFLAGALIGSGLATAGSASASATTVQSKTETAVFKVTGMTCGGCEVGVRMAVGKLDGVEKVEASYEKGIATVQYDAAKVTPKEIQAAIEKLGYQAELEKKGAK